MAFHTDFRFVDYVDGKGERKPNPEPELIYGPVYSVGPLTVCAYALETADGLVVVDTGYASDGDLIPDNIRKLGLNPADIKLIINTHWHPDHAGGNARLVEISGATLAVHELDAEVVEAGRYKGGHKFPSTAVTRRLSGGEAIEVGSIAFEIVHTPGQSAGSIVVTVTVDGPDGACRALFAGDSTGFKNDVKTLERLGYPGVCADFRRTVEIMRGLEFDLYCGGHPHQVFREMRADGNPFVSREEWLQLVRDRAGKMEDFVREHPKYLDW